MDVAITKMSSKGQIVIPTEMRKDIKEGDIVQFARFGFCRLDKKEKNNLKFWFTHK